MNAEKCVHHKINSLEPNYDEGFKTNIGVAQVCHLKWIPLKKGWVQSTVTESGLSCFKGFLSSSHLQKPAAFQVSPLSTKKSLNSIRADKSYFKWEDGTAITIRFGELNAWVETAILRAQEFNTPWLSKKELARVCDLTRKLKNKSDKWTSNTTCT